ncbi:MAG: response regulator [Desulfamplus sp.]|nr:response regulator [Desulfamplus sp.]
MENNTPQSKTPKSDEILETSSQTGKETPKSDEILATSSQTEKKIPFCLDNLNNLSSEDIEKLSVEEIKKVIHELQVHKIELAMQNEELVLSHAETSATRSRYFNLYDLAPVGYCTLSEKGIVLESNLTAATMLGVPRSYISTNPITRFILNEDQDIYYKHRKQLFETGEPQSFELRMKKEDGTSFWVHMEAASAHNEGEPVLHLVLIDITDLKQGEEDRKMLQLQLDQAQRMESVGRLAGGVAHDFNNMLHVIFGNTELAMDLVDSDSSLHEHLVEILSTAKRSADIVRQLLAFARKQTALPVEIDLNEVIEGMLKMLRRLIMENITLVWQPCMNLWAIQIDPSQIDQILANLCINARDSISGVGNIIIETKNITIDDTSCQQIKSDVAYCSSKTLEPPGDYILLTVSDNGCGIDKENIKNIFEPFFTTKEFGKGTGLGLATVYGIVKQNNGFINVYSEPGKGATFKIYLPRYLNKSESAQKEYPHEVPLDECDGNETILIVDDAPVILKMGRIMLERLGYQVLTADMPGKAITLVKEHEGEIHLLLTDVIMPEMDGWELSGKIRNLRPDIKCLFMSGYTADLISEDGKLDKNTHFLQKPFSQKLLSAKIKEVLNC